MATTWDRTARQIEADAVDDLAGHRKLQSPAGQEFVDTLRGGYHSEKTTPLLPWLAREFRKGRIRPRLPLEHQLENHTVGRALPDEIKDALRLYDRHFVGALDEPPTHPGADLGALYDQLTRYGRTPLYYHDPAIDPEQYSQWQTLGRDAVQHWGDWYSQDDRRKVPIEQLKVHELGPEVERYQREKSKRLQNEGVEEGRHQGQVVHSWPDGWTLRRLPHGPALDFEAWHMRGDPDPRDPSHPHGAPICVNWPQYQSQVEDGATAIYSLRDPQGNPHVTTEITPVQDDPHREKEFGPAQVEYALAHDPSYAKWDEQNKQRIRDYMERIHYNVADARLIVPENEHDEQLWSIAWDLRDRFSQPSIANGEIRQIQGKGNSVPKPEYQARMKDWFQTFPENERPNWEADESALDDPDDIMHHLDGTAEPEGAMGGYGAHGDYGLAESMPPIAYDRALENSMEPDRGGHGPTWKHDYGEAVYQGARKRGEIPQLAKAVEDFGERQRSNFDEWLAMNWGTGAPIFPAEEDENSPAMQQYYEDLSEWESEHAGVVGTTQMYELLGPHWQHGEKEGTGAYVNAPPQPQTTFSNVEAPPPVRRLWAFSPQSGKVHLHDESDHHPADAPTHESIAADLGEVGLHHGYAYTIPGGWRVLDYHHEPVADPFVLRSVVEALRKTTR